MDSKHHLPVPRNTTSVTTALAVIPPPALWPRIQTMRRTLDPAFPRWPPHINLLYPFLHPRLLDDDAQSLIASAVGALDEERVALTATEIFYARNRAYVIAQPPPTATGPDTDGCNDDDDGAAADDLLQQLHRRLLQEFPACASLTKYAGGYTPHLTLARTNWNAKQPKQHREAVDQVAAAVQRIVSPSDGRHLSWDAQGVYLLTRPGGSSNEAPFSFSAYYPLAGGDAADPYGLVGTTYDPNVLPPTPTATTTMEADGRDRRASFSEVAWPHPHGIVGIAEPGSDDDPQSLDSTPPTPPLPPESASEPLPVPPATRPGFHDTWTAYPRAASPSDLTAAKYDQTWLLLPTSRYSADDRKWAPVDPESIAAMPVSAETAPERLSVLTYNVLNPNHYPLGQRTEALLTDLAALASDLHLIAFQEVTSGFLAQVLDQAWVRDGWYVSHGGPEWCEGFPGAGGQVILARVPFATMFLRWTHQKHALAVQIPSWNAVVVNVHLTSSHATNTQPAGKRLAQMESVAQFLARHSPRVTSSTRDQRPSSQQSSSLALVVGDWNTADPAENALLISRHGLVDSAELLGESLITFDPTTNALAREISSAGADATGRSIDRVIMRPATGWFPVQQRLVGEQHAAEGAAASDHYGLVVSFQHLSGAEHGSLLPLGPSAAALDAPLTQAQIHQALTDLGDYDSPSTAQKRRDALHLVTAHLNALRGDVPPLGVPFLIPVGSAKLGLHSPSSDVDSIALISVPTETFCDAIKATPIAGGTDLRLIQVVPYATVPTARFLAFNEIAVDVQLASPGHMFFMKANEYLADPLGEWPPMRRTAALALASFRVSAALAMHLTPVTRLALRVLRRWATLAGIYASRPGYFNGTALLVMLLRVANADPTLAGTDQDQDQGQDQDNVDDDAVKNAQTECSVARLVAAFFREYHQFPFGSVTIALEGAPTAPTRSAMDVEAPGPLPRVNVMRHATIVTREVMVQAFADAVGPHPEATLARPSQLVRDILAGNVAGHSMFTMRYPLYINAAIGRSGAARQTGWRRAVSRVAWARVLDRIQHILPPDVHVHLWPTPWMSVEQAHMSEEQLRDFDGDVVAHFLLGISAAKQEPRLLEVLVAEINAAIGKRPEETAAVGSVPAGSSWWTFVSTVPADQMAGLGLVPSDREWADDVSAVVDAGDAPPATVIGDDLAIAAADASPTPDRRSDDDDEQMDSPPVAAKSPKSKKKQTTGSAAASTSVQGKLRSSKDIMNRLLWDKAAYDPNDYVVGYLDRFDGIMERALLAFKPDDESDPDWVPMHRIVHFRRVSDNVKVWDRKNKIDLVFHR